MTESPLPVVGVGASAGGLEALREMFEGFRGAPGIAFVVVQHLDPTHESLMAQLIERYTDMTVQQAEGGEVLSANQVYVIPPGHGLAVKDGVLLLTEFTDPRGMRRPIDDFFVSLASAYGNMAACVILSGTGADGSRGLRAIKEEGGLAVAQEPESAKYDGMPVTAISTGLVDIVSPPEAIIPHLVDFFSRSSTSFSLDAAESDVPDHIETLCDILRDTLGHNFNGYKRPTLGRRIARRMHVLGLDNPIDYVSRVRDDRSECEALFRDLLINVTKFFRDKDEFAVLKERFIDPLISTAYNAQDIRIWVPGCSSGEEAYTLAILCAESMRQFDVRPHIQIFATDIDEGMLSIGRSGVYPVSALTDIPAEYRMLHTISGMNNFSVSPRIREMVRFSQHNLVRDPPFSGIDLVSCRNLLIYFDDVLQRQVFPLFHFALRRETGCLFLGSSESVGKFDDLFEPIDQPARLFRRRDVKSNYAVQSTGRHWPRSARDSKSAPYPEARQRRDTGHDLALKRVAETYAPASLLVDGEGNLIEKWGQAEKFLKFPDRLERQINVNALARPGLRESIGPLLRSVASKQRREGIKLIEVRTEFGVQPVSLVCDPIQENAYLLVIREVDEFRNFTADTFDEFDVGDEQIRFLEDELQSVRHHLRSAVEELETSNEELKSSNEEMMSMNEELQSTNEELTTVNDELKSKVDELTVANSDLNNFFDSTDVAMVVVDGNMRVRSFTQAARGIFSLADTSVGRPLSAIETRLQGTDYLQMVESSAQQERQRETRLRTAKGDEYFIRTFPYRRLDGKVDGATLILTDITEMLTLEKDLSAERHRLKLALQVAGIGIWEYEPATDRTLLDETERRLLDIHGDEGGTMEKVLSKLPQDDRDRINQALRLAMDGSQLFDQTFQLPLKNGETRWLHGLGRRITLGDRQRFIGVTFDITAERQVLAQREIMIREMNHRVKNLFALISGLVSISARETDDSKQLASLIRKRIYALGKSHALTVQAERSEPVSLARLIETVTEPALSKQNFTVDGPEILISPSHVGPVALILHEWATNSTKYGALSQPDGNLSIAWNLLERQLILDWVERGASDTSGGPGFGTTLIAASAAQIGAKVEGKRTRTGYKRQLAFEIDAPGEATVS